MQKQLILFLTLILSPLTLHATDISSGRFSFHLSGEWHVTEDENGSITAIHKQNEATRAFILSVHKLVSEKEIMDALIFLHNYLETLSTKNSSLKKETEFTQFLTTGSAPFDYIAYTDRAQNGFLIGATLGSNSGVVLITYEGDGKYTDGISELKTILNNMKVIQPR